MTTSNSPTPPGVSTEKPGFVSTNSVGRFALPSFSAWTLLALAVSALVVVPIGTVLFSLTQDSQGEWAHLAATRLPGYLINTLIIAVGVCTCAAGIGTATAWLVTTCDFPCRRLFSWALILPLAVPAYIAAYAYADLLQFSGPLQTWLRATFEWNRDDYWFPDIRTRGGAIFILTATLYPYVYLAARTAFLEQSACTLEVARTLGRGPWRAFVSVALPLARPSIAAGTALVLMETLADFGAVEHCAVDTLATGVYHTWRSLENHVAAAQLASLLLGIVALAVCLEALARRRARHHQLSNRFKTIRRKRLGPISSALAMLLCGLPMLAGFMVPAGIFVYRAIMTGDARGAEIAISHGKNSLLLASIAAVVAVVFAVLVTYAHRLSKGRIAAIAARVTSLGYALPGTVLGLGVLIPLTFLDHRINDLTQWLFNTRPGLLLTGTAFAVMLGYQTRFLGVALAMLQSAFQRVRPSLDDAARTLGASRWRLVLLVHLPILRASVLAAGLLVFVDVVKELPVTLMLRPFNFDTLAVRTYQLASDERLDQAAFSALLIIALGLIPVALLATLLAPRRAPVKKNTE
ncbi:ABC transporter permease [Poriferisphaera sp. WC338]|uniref:ABC transporter permease n=1 Tax=Poriferisphaera sp. WC338 TaxID=3425129 RepID=UPI003D813A8B